MAAHPPRPGSGATPFATDAIVGTAVDFGALPGLEGGVACVAVATVAVATLVLERGGARDAGVRRCLGKESALAALVLPPGRPNRRRGGVIPAPAWAGRRHCRGDQLTAGDTVGGGFVIE